MLSNMDIRIAAKTAEAPLWKIAEAMNIGTNTLYTRLRKELSAEEKSLYFATIHKIAQDQVQTVQKSLNTNANTGTMACQAKRARAAYYRDWRKKNPGKASEYQKRYWERKYQKEKTDYSIRIDGGNDMKGYKSKITQDAIDRAHFLKNQNPKMSNDVLAATLFGEGYTPRKYSGTVVGLMLKVNTIDEYLNLPANTKKQYKKQTEIIVEQDDLDEQSESEHDETYQDQQREDSEIINDLYKVFHEEMQEETEKATETDAKDQERQQTQYEDRSDYDCFEMRVKKMAEICERFLLCKGTNGYPDESIATKTSGIAAYLACIRKSLNAFHGDYKADSQNASKAYDVIFEKLDELDENQKSIMNNQNKMVELFSESNKLLKRVVELWETPSNNAEI